MPEFIPTEEQAAALEQIKTWLNIPIPEPGILHVARKPDPATPFFVLSGYAGTGKSLSILELIRGLFRPSEVCFTAPTNKAVKVLRSYLNEAGFSGATTATVYSLLGLSLQTNGEVKEIAKPDESVDLSGFKLIIVDEGSMVNRFLLSAIEDAYQDWSVPFLFMGDPAQLPPVGEISSPIWKIENSAQLTKVMRYGNSILDLATSIRTVVDHPFPTVNFVHRPPVFKVRRSELFTAITDNLDQIAAGESKVIAWRNSRVDEFNRFIRQHIFGLLPARENLWLPTDKIVATAHLKDLDDVTFMRTDEEAMIESVVEARHPRFREYGTFDLLVQLESGRKKTINTIHPSSRQKLDSDLNIIAMEAKAAAGQARGQKWRDFWRLKEAFHEVRHSYALTSHRSQGSSYLKVFVDLEDIMRNRNRSEAFRSLYVSVTRARKEVWIA